MGAELSPDQQAIRDLQEIRLAIEKAERIQDRKRSAKDLKTHSMILVLMMVSSGIFLIHDCFFSPSLTNILYATHFLDTLRYIGVASIFVFLLCLLSVLYLVLSKVSAQAGESLEEYLDRNFSYLRSMSFISDLFVKFAAISLVILAGRPDWVAPLLVTFTGDYLIQGRFFVLPYRLSLILGVGYLVGSAILLIYFEGQLAYALVPFIILSLISFLHIQGLRRKRPESEARSSCSSIQ